MNDLQSIVYLVVYDKIDKEYKHIYTKCPTINNQNPDLSRYGLEVLHTTEINFEKSIKLIQKLNDKMNMGLSWNDPNIYKKIRNIFVSNYKIENYDSVLIQKIIDNVDTFICFLDFHVEITDEQIRNYFNELFVDLKTYENRVKTEKKQNNNNCDFKFVLIEDKDTNTTISVFTKINEEIKNSKYEKSISSLELLDLISKVNKDDLEKLSYLHCITDCESDNIINLLDLFLIDNLSKNKFEKSVETLIIKEEIETLLKVILDENLCEDSFKFLTLSACLDSYIEARIINNITDINEIIEKGIIYCSSTNQFIDSIEEFEKLKIVMPNKNEVVSDTPVSDTELKTQIGLLIDQEYKKYNLEIERLTKDLQEKTITENILINQNDSLNKSFELIQEKLLTLDNIVSENIELKEQLQEQSKSYDKLLAELNDLKNKTLINPIESNLIFDIIEEDIDKKSNINLDLTQLEYFKGLKMGIENKLELLKLINGNSNLLAWFEYFKDIQEMSKSIQKEYDYILKNVK